MTYATDIPQLLKAVQDNGSALDRADLTTSQALLSSARALVSALEPPHEKFERIITHYPTLLVSVRLGIELKLFNALLEHDGAPKSVDSLATTVGADPVLLERIMRHLASENIIKETGPNEYASSTSTAIFTAASMTGLAKVLYEMLGPVSSGLLEYFKKNKFSNPSTQSPWQYAMGTDLSAFQWLFQPGNEELAQAMRDGMQARAETPKWYQTLPVEEILGHPSDPDAVLFIDVGGNEGKDVLGFQKAFSHLPGRILLQDLPPTINKLDAASLKPIEAIGYDFFTPQTVKGAKAYYLKNILHDWSDEKCKLILTNLKNAMTPGYSKILINDAVIPDTGATWKETSADILMMLGHGAMERGEAAWRTLVEALGLKITKIWEVKGASEKLIEMELV